MTQSEPVTAPPYPDPSRRHFSGSSTVRPVGIVIGLFMVVGGVVGTWGSWRFFVGTTEGQLLDTTAFRGSEIGRSTLWRAAEPVLDVIDIPFVVVVLGAVAAIAVLRNRWLLAIQVAVLVGGANITTQLLKHVVFDRPALIDGWAGNSLPSGHTTVAASVAAALVLVVPRGMRPLVAIGAAAYAGIAGVSTMIGGWHRPSDVVAAICVVLAWAGLATVITAMGTPEPGATANPARASTAIVAVVLWLVAAVSGVFAGIALQRTREALASTSWLDSRTDLATAYVGGALGVVAVTALAFAVILVAHQIASSPRRP